ncbi:serine/threonine-protein kinase [Mariniblastus fucicola]|uniref:Serine/threonine-protein kinase PknB n=1 Tax=Mariniblastus fucicola TaxID=980251 RepID=A0A5B9P9J2_9BACT|nr:serine/threonine-protein kinase [Mariniblastus fucicola]QEG23417.1 Serine/threonine-protein kinase PknB [Mariniblastus fucicola]
MDGDETIPNDHERETTPSAGSNSSSEADFTLNAPSFEEVAKTNIVFDNNAAPMQIFDRAKLPQVFGNYRLDEIVGEGGAGVVFKATPLAEVDSSSPTSVAVKVIRPAIMANSRAVQRFEKESRILASINCRYATRFIEFGKESGVYFIVSEFVSGVTLRNVIAQTKLLPGKVSLRLIADLLKAIQAIHDAGAIHRDVKPGNVIVAFDESPLSQTPQIENFSVAKLTDFGLARNLDQTESMDMTRQQSMMGTPLYMAPEQFTDSRSVDARADIYSVGVTLYQLLAGRPPFVSEEAIELGEMHRRESPMPLTIVRSDISEAISQVVLKALEKSPDMRYQTAEEMLADVQRILDGQPTVLHTLPQVPDNRVSSVRRYAFEWTLSASAKQLWPLVSDTDRFNRAIDLPAPEFSFDHSGKEKQVFATAKFNGMAVRWREHPFQWNSGRELSVLREFEKGPFEWVTSTVELQPLTQNRTRVVHKFEVQPRGLLGRMFTPIQFGLLTGKGLKKAYARIDRIAQNESCGYACDFPYAAAPKLTAGQRKLIEGRTMALGQAIGNVSRAESFTDYLVTVADPFVAKIRPIVLGRKLGCSTNDALELCFRAVESSLIGLHWDIICPVCRVSAGNVSVLEQVDQHSHCEACNQGFEIDFTKTVEAVFCINPEVRHVEQKTFCIGGPFHAPHVLAQNHLLPDQQVQFEADVAPGRYEARAPQFDRSPSMDVSNESERRRAKFLFGSEMEQPASSVGAGQVVISIGNQSDREILVRFQQQAETGDAFSAAAAFEHPLFSKLMPERLLQPDQLVGKSNAYLLTVGLTDADELAEQVGEIMIREAWKSIQNRFSEPAATATAAEFSGDVAVIAFDNVFDLVKSLLVLLDKLGDTNPVLCDGCFGISSGQIMSGSQTNQPAIFGKAIRNAKSLVASQPCGTMLVAAEIWELLTSEHSDASGVLAKFTKHSDPTNVNGKAFVRLSRA